jgi:endonuclease/exonuclease/phosphatase family metal-dependent hydrolase
VSLGTDEPSDLRSELSPASRLRVMTWNLWWEFGPFEQRWPAICAVVAAEELDVVLLQEVSGREGEPTVADRLAAQLGSFHVGQTDGPWFNGRSFGNAIVSRWPLSEVTTHALPNAAGEPGHRRAITAVAETPWGRWPLVSAHLDHRFDGSALRQRQATRLLEIVDSLRGDPAVSPPVVLGVDMNATPDSDEVRLLTGRSAGPVPNLVLSDAWEQRGSGPGFTWTADNPHSPVSAWPNRRIDYVFVSWPRPKPLGNPAAVWLAGAEDVEGVRPSDHAAVVVDLVVAPGLTT